jgi:hypothetical protein
MTTYELARSWLQGGKALFPPPDSTGSSVLREGADTAVFLYANPRPGDGEDPLYLTCPCCPLRERTKRPNSPFCGFFASATLPCAPEAETAYSAGCRCLLPGGRSRVDCPFPRPLPRAVRPFHGNALTKPARPRLPAPAPAAARRAGTRRWYAVTLSAILNVTAY